MTCESGRSVREELEVLDLKLSRLRAILDLNVVSAEVRGNLRASIEQTKARMRHLDPRLHPPTYRLAA